MATGCPSSTASSALSPGMTMSAELTVMIPTTSVVRKKKNWGR
jgi:hypothetical protein